jgi:hypothetical protein
LRRAESGRNNPDDKVGETGEGEEDCSDEKEEAKRGEFFVLGGVAGDLEEEEKEAGGYEENEPDGDAGEFGGNSGAHELELNVTSSAYQLPRIKCEERKDLETSLQKREPCKSHNKN